MRIFIADPAALERARERALGGDPALRPAIEKLRAEAEAALEVRPVSVMDKLHAPPSGDKHDYMSLAPYHWPNPETPDGLPYVNRDGPVNPERNEYDRPKVDVLMGSVDTLALAYWVTGDERYAAHAALFLRTWFLDPQTRMNPHLRYGQAIKGVCEGRRGGAIDFRGFDRTIDSIGLLGGSLAWTNAEDRQLREWLRAFLAWLRESDLGQEESRSQNNHGTWYDAQVCLLALATGQPHLARETLEARAFERIATQIEPDGRMPNELRRTRALHYSTMNLIAWLNLARLGGQVGVDLWRFETDDGRSIRRGLDWLLPYALRAREWLYQQITEYVEPILPVLRRAANAFGAPEYEARVAALPGAAAAREQLLFPAGE